MKIEGGDDGVAKSCKDNGVNFKNIQSFLQEAIQNGDIPEWLLIEFFIRLSTKDVCRFKLVSKQWLSIISDPCFMRDYVSRSKLVSRQPWTFISHRMYHAYCDKTCVYFTRYVLLDNIASQVLEPNYCVLPLPCTHQSNSGESYSVCGVSNGLVLYASSLNEVPKYYICNPVTGQWFPVQSLPFTKLFSVRCGFLTQVEDYVLKSYRIVRLQPLCSDNVTKFEVFFSEIGEWKNFTISGCSVIDFRRREPIYLNGILHWEARDIIAYDPYHSPEQMRIIPLPNGILDQREGGYFSMCAACHGNLRFFQISCMYRGAPPDLQLWVLNDYSSGDWCLQSKINWNDVSYIYSIKTPPFSFSVTHLCPISFDPFDSDLIYMAHDDRMLTYNIKTTKLEDLRKCSSGNQKAPGIPMWDCSFFLMIPPWPTSILRGDGRLEENGSHALQCRTGATEDTD